MKILLIVDETPFFHPKFVNDLVESLKKDNHEINVGLVKKIGKKNSIYKYLVSNFTKLNLSEIILLGLKRVIYFISNFFLPKGFKNRFFSVRSVLKKKNIKYFLIEKNINQTKYYDVIKKLDVDLIISSNSLYFGETILKLPKKGCINRHTSLLPSYGGVWPVLQCIANNESYTGVTIHQMTNILDEGKILSQKVISLENNRNLNDIYKIAFRESPNLIIEAINNLANGKFIENNYKKSYYSFPNDMDWSKFRKNGGKFI
tara:strand:- start:291 stop:1070 length:780 start_codon:yes stop_codon:yes gene_type:complete